MSIPITQGSLKTVVTDMAVGDYIAATYTTTAMTAHGTFSNIGTTDTVAVSAFSSSSLTGYVYLMKIAKGTLVSLSQLYSGVTYSIINASNRIYGEKVTIGDKNYLLRVPTIKEYISMCGTLDGKLIIADRYNNFNTPSGVNTYEVIQENFNLTEGGFEFVTSPATSANAISMTTARYARLILEYSDDSKCTDLYH